MWNVTPYENFWLLQENMCEKYFYFFCSPKDNYEEVTYSEDDVYGEESTDRRLKDHNDLHVLDFGKDS